MNSNRVAIRVSGALCALLLALPGFTQERAANDKPLPSAEQILDKYERFLGGSAALSKVQTRVTITRRVEKSATPADTVLVRRSKKPMFSIMHHEALDGTFYRYMNGCDGTTGWVGYPQAKDEGLAKVGEASTDGNCEQEQFYYGYLSLDVARLKQNIQRLEVKGTVQIVTAEPSALGALAGGRGKDLVPAALRQAYLVLSVPRTSADQHVWLYFDTETGALLRRADAGRGPTLVQPGLNQRYTDFIQYRNVGDGTRAPFQFVSTAPNSEVRGVTVSIEDNGPIADDTFVRPKDVRRQDKGLAN